MRILFLTHRLPYAPNRGDRLRAWHILRRLARDHDVALVSLAHDADEQSRVDDLAGLADIRVAIRVPALRNRMRGAAALASGSRTPLTHLLLDAPEMRPSIARVVAAAAPDVVLAYCSSMTRFALEPPLDRFPLVIDMIDADSAKWADLAAVTRGPLSWIYRREARVLGRFEAEAMRRAITTTVVNEREHAVLAALAPDADIRVVPNGVDVAHFSPPGPPAAGHDVVFCGVMDYAPNAAGAVWLANEVWPLVRRRYADATLWLVGARPSAAVAHLASAAGRIQVTGAVDDMRPYLWRAAVAAAPLKTARGVQNKVLEAVAAGLPTVVTPAVRQGLPETVQPACATAETPQAFADRILDVLAMSPDERRKMAAAAELSGLGWDARLQSLAAVLEGAKDSPHKPRT
jgi:sugar transferase (PEP-CTERM/EpsH1 system associated)